MRGIVIACLAHLADEFGATESSDGDQPRWRAYEELRELEAQFKERKIPMWDQKEFDAGEAATALHGYIEIPGTIPPEDDDD